ncbi:hypothetical protein ACBZ90_18365 (plasmid) [Vibrio alginolyticus]
MNTQFELTRPFELVVLPAVNNHKLDVLFDGVELASVKKRPPLSAVSYPQ